MHYPEDVVREAGMKNDIVDVISGYMKLTKKGNDYFGLCPFHNEKSPSFSIAPTRQMHYCFSCGAGGSIIALVMEYENHFLSEALQMLADRAGVTLPRGEYPKEARVQADIQVTLLKIDKLTVNYFYYQLGQLQDKVGYDYLRRGELSDETIRRFGPDFVSKTNDDLHQYLKKKGYNDTILKKTSLTTIEERGTHDKLQNRVMFPTIDINNQVISFGDRVIGDGAPRYLGSPKTKLFDKSQNLCGLNYTRTSREKYILTCEGYMNIIAIHQVGFTNVMASLGTTFTTQHVALLKRYTIQVILACDSDGTGIKTALRAIPILEEVGMSTKVLGMESYKNPDEFMKNLGADVFRRRVTQAENSFMFKIDVIKKDYDMGDPEQKTAFCNKAAERPPEFQDASERDNYLEAVSREHSINYQDLRQLVNRLGSHLDMMVKRPEREEAPEWKKKKKDDGSHRLQRLLLTWLIGDPELSDKIGGVVSANNFREDLHHQVAVMVFEGHTRGEVGPTGTLNHFISDEEQYKEVAALPNASLRESLDSEEQKKAFSETVIKMRKHSLDEASRNAKGITELQEIIKAQSALKDLNIPLD